MRVCAALLPSPKIALLDPCAAALDQDEQNYDNQYCGNNPDDQSSVHCNSFFFQQDACYAPRFEQLRATPGARTATFPDRETADRPAKKRA